MDAFCGRKSSSDLITEYLAWLLEKRQQANKKGLVMVWDHASWHKSKTVQTWIRAHNRAVKKSGQGVRLLAFLLPKKSP